MTEKNQDNAGAIEKIELDLFLEGVFRVYGYDFRDYASSSIRRRIMHMMSHEKLHTVSELQDCVLHDACYMDRFLSTISINVTSMFRDPYFYRAFQRLVVPLLKPLPFIRIWHVGCSTGEEVYSMAILLKEAGLYEKTKIYATDINEGVLGRAKKGIYPLCAMKEYTDNYIRAGCTGSFSEYYSADSQNAIISPALQENVLWAQHNLVTDASFNEFDIILCRNVMIYFNKALQDRVHALLYGSLKMDGVLGLGAAESLRFTAFERQYRELDGKAKIYQKVE